MKAEHRVLAISVASGRVGHVLVVANDITDLGMSRKASTGPDTARAYAAKQIEKLRPDVVITEKLRATSRKGHRTRAVIAAIRSVAEVAEVLDVEVIRGHSQANRFEEAEDIADRYPALRSYLPRRRRPWESEPKTLIYFEAVSLVESVFGQPAGNAGHAA